MTSRSGDTSCRTTGDDAVLAAVESWTERLSGATADWGRPIDIDGRRILTERARQRGLVPRGRISQGGFTRLVRCADGWVAVALARDSDRELVPAWRGLLGAGPMHDDPARPDEVWSAVEDLVGARTGADLVDTAALLGLPVGLLGERPADRNEGIELASFGSVTPVRGRPVRVVELSALWAGPLCAGLLVQAGAEVTKLESLDRPDGARTGDPLLYRQLNRDKRELRPDMHSASGRRALEEMITEADVVVTSSRRRALDQLGLTPERWLDHPTGPQVWVSITGHGLGSNRVAFGDDAAVSGGLVDHDELGPTFLGDAIADPLSGLAAAVHTSESLVTGERVLLDVSMAAVAASIATARTGVS